MKKTLSILFVLTLAVCIGIASVAFASAPAVEISADVYYGDYTGERVDVEGKATIAFGTTVNVTSEEYGIVVATYGNEWSGTATELKYFAKSNESGKFGVAVYGLTDGFYGLKAYVYDKDTQAYTYSEDEVKICIGYSAVTLVRPEADDVVEYVKTGTAYADPAITGVDAWNTFDGTTYTTYDFTQVVNEDITLHAETITYELSNQDPIVLYTDTSMSGTAYETEPVTLPYLRKISSLKGVQAQNAGWYPANGNPNVVIENGKIKATGKMSGKVVLKSGDTELDVTVKSPVLSAADLDALSLVTFYGDVVASSEYYGKAQAYLDGHYELINDIDYATYERANDTFTSSTISSVQNADASKPRIPDVGYMLPIATFAPKQIKTYVSAQDSGVWGVGAANGSSYSKTWLSILGDYLEEVSEDYTPTSTADKGAGNTYKAYSLKIKSGVTSDGAQKDFMGINPQARMFRGTFDGAGKTISNAWLMLDNYLVSTTVNSGDATVAVGQYMHFIGRNSGNVQNLVFDNLGIGSALDYYGYTATANMYSDSLKSTAYSILGYSGVESNGQGLGLKHSGLVTETASNRKYYNVMYNENVIKTPVSMQTANGTIRTEGLGNALIGINSGKLENIVMNYRSSGSAYNGTSTAANMKHTANGLCWLNESAGQIDNVIINRQGEFGLVIWNKYQHYSYTRSGRSWNCLPESRYCVSTINNGSVNNVFVFNDSAVSSTACAGTGTFNITIVSTDGTNNVAGMDTTNCNTFIQNYVAGLNG